MGSRITIKDVAREAGVSVATVSYVVNNRTDVNISDATRKKVLQITNLLGYTPNGSAQALATSQKRMLACYFPSSPSVLVKADRMYVMDALSSFLNTKNYGLIYLSDSYTERYDHADAIVCYDVSSEFFRQVGDRNFVPLLAFDCLIGDDGLFFQINTDYSKAEKAAREYFGDDSYTLLALDTPNQEKKELLSSVFPSVAYVSDYAGLAAYTDRKILVLHQVLNDLLSPLIKSESLLCYKPALSRQKAEALFQCMEYAMERNAAVCHDVRV